MSTAKKRRFGRWLVAIVIFAAALAIFVLFMRYITKEPNPSENTNPASLVLIDSGILRF